MVKTLSKIKQGQDNKRSQIRSFFCRFSQILVHSLEFLGITALRRRRKPQETADFRRNPFVPCSLSFLFPLKTHPQNYGCGPQKRLSRCSYRLRPEKQFFFGLILDPPPPVRIYSEKKANSFVPARFFPLHGLFRKREGTGTGIRLSFPCSKILLNKGLWTLHPQTSGLNLHPLNSGGIMGRQDRQTNGGLAQKAPIGQKGPFLGNFCFSPVAVRCRGIGPDPPRKGPDRP